MGAGSLAGPRGLEGQASLLPRREDLAELVRRADVRAVQALTDEGVGVRGIRHDLKSRGLLREQVHEELVGAVGGVDLQKGRLDGEDVSAQRPVPDVLEDAPGRALHQAGGGRVVLRSAVFLRRSTHGVRFACVGRSVAEHCTVATALHDVLNYGGRLCEELLLCGLRAEVGVAPRNSRGVLAATRLFPCIFGSIHSQRDLVAAKGVARDLEGRGRFGLRSASHSHPHARALARAARRQGLQLRAQLRALARVLGQAAGARPEASMQLRQLLFQVGHSASAKGRFAHNRNRAVCAVGSSKPIANRRAVT
mmetsp:Transcript_26399/g.87534  ORF Transcript_26399/g.87534 Transcript_26399/m.87534 type:complete len:309 (+) Transcript_26399:1648-2574(+)